MQFYAVVGNPPYQKKNNDAKRWTLWVEFVQKSKELSDNISMVVPQSITNPSNFWLIKDSLEVLNTNISDQFNVGSTFCYFSVNNKKVKSTKLISKFGEFNYDVSKLDFLPFDINDKTLKQMDDLVNRNSKKWQRGELHTSKKHLFDDSGEYEVMHTNAQTLNTNHNHDNRSKIRVVVTLSGYPKFNVIHNKYCSQACMWTEFTTMESANKFAEECNGEYVQNIMKTFKWSGWNSKEIIEYL